MEASRKDPEDQSSRDPKEHEAHRHSCLVPLVITRPHDCWTLIREIKKESKVDRVLSNQTLSSTVSLLTSNIPFPWFLVLGCNREAPLINESIIYKMLFDLGFGGHCASRTGSLSLHSQAQLQNQHYDRCSWKRMHEDVLCWA